MEITMEITTSRASNACSDAGLAVATVTAVATVAVAVAVAVTTVAVVLAARLPPTRSPAPWRGLLG